MASKQEYKKLIDSFFSKKKFAGDDVRKIRNLAMKNRIRLGKYRSLFCKHCLSQLKGVTRINSGYKTVICSVCKKSNRFRIN